MKKHLKKWRIVYLMISQLLLCWIPILDPFFGIYFKYQPMHFRFDFLNFAFAIPSAINLTFLFYYGIKDYQGKD